MRRSSSFTAPLRESFFDLAQRYHRLREAAFSRSKPAPKSLPPPIPLTRERRLTDLPPPPADDSATESMFADRYVDEAPEEETLVQPLARRPSDAPPASERRQFTTVRPPPPPDPLPRILPSTAPLALATVPPLPPSPPPSIWRPMLVTAAMSATIGAIVSVGMWAVRSPASSEKARAEVPAATATTTSSPAAANTIGPCPIPTSASLSSSSSLSSSQSSSSSASHANSSGLHEVSLEALPVETTSPRAAAVVTPVLRAPAPAAPARIAHLDLTEHTPKHAAAPEPPRAAPERPAAPERAAPVESEKPSKHGRKAKAEASDAADNEAALAAAGAPEPAPTPTAGPDRAAIAKAVGRAAAAASSCEASPQSGRAQITFAPSGNVASVQLLEPFSDNAVNGCVLRALGRAHVPPFAGEPVIVRKGLSW
ncbi:MAG TPA: hypothetical protein VMI54_00845 [Polyangiaceae bacterium]|nr:hypothetical protein [Polyangiaceae bacterium]